MVGTATAFVVFLHPMGEGARWWHPVAAALPDGLEALTPTLPGLADLDPHVAEGLRLPPGLRGEHGFALDAAFDLVALVADHVGRERVHVCGHGLGAAVALGAALRHPSRVSSLVLSAPLLDPPLALTPAQRRASEGRIAAAVAGPGVGREARVAAATVDPGDGRGHHRSAPRARRRAGADARAARGSRRGGPRRRRDRRGRHPGRATRGRAPRRSRLAERGAAPLRRARRAVPPGGGTARLTLTSRQPIPSGVR